MEYILIIAAIFNLIGSISIWFQAPIPVTQESKDQLPSDYMQCRIFTGGTALLFSVIYLYVFLFPELALPLLSFGIALKLWSFASAFISYLKFNFPKDEFLKVGVANLLFAILFIAYLLTM
ncbi:hypothetical protein [Litoribacillus peritrichatus]|uniref:Uncharacterized protein n=1 Tax=Litoribacillus peritrichatus TaxID=718191 RepID=A0ABP7M811_9GAMM